MINTIGGGKTKCPFYLKEGEKTICCEGFLDTNKVRVVFFTPEKKKNFQENFCFTDCYRGCPLAIAANEKYFVMKEG